MTDETKANAIKSLILDNGNLDKMVVNHLLNGRLITMTLMLKKVN